MFYASNMPIMLESALTSRVYIVSQKLFSYFPDDFLVKLLGVWEVPQVVRFRPFCFNIYIASVAYGRISATCCHLWLRVLHLPPAGLHLALVDPIHTILYILFMRSVCAMFSKTPRCSLGDLFCSQRTEAEVSPTHDITAPFPGACGRGVAHVSRWCSEFSPDLVACLWLQYFSYSNFAGQAGFPKFLREVIFSAPNNY
jgi:hypothetical protein